MNRDQTQERRFLRGSERAAWLARPFIGDVEPIHGVVLPGGMTLIRLSVDGWGWITARIVGEKSASKRYFVGRTVLRMQLPVNETILFVAANLWGRQQMRFIIHPTANAMPGAPAVPELQALPSIAPIRAVNLALPGLRVRHPATPGPVSGIELKIQRLRSPPTDRQLRPPWIAVGVPGYQSSERLAAIEGSPIKRSRQKGQFDRNKN